MAHIPAGCRIPPPPGGLFQDRVAEGAIEIEERILAFARNRGHHRLDEHVALKYVKGNGVVRREPVGAVCPA